MRLVRLCLLALLIMLNCDFGLAQSPAPIVSPAQPKPSKLLVGVKSWGYQLQNVDTAEIAQSPLDLVVIDYSRNGVDTGRYTNAEIMAMQRKPDGGRRLVLAYLSIGEAEDYRFYWNSKWVEPAPLKRSSQSTLAAPSVGPLSADIPTVRIPRLVAPGWLGRENERWHGNYLVRFWYDGWQEIVIYGDNSYLARIQSAGFDGVYLDRVDAYYGIESDRSDAARRMVDLVTDLAKVARQRQPDFLIITQNAEELLRQPKYLAAINGVAKEDLLFGATAEGVANAPDIVATTADHLLQAQGAGLPVLVVEYLDEEEKKLAAAAGLRSRGFVPYFGPRKLDRLSLPPPMPR